MSRTISTKTPAPRSENANPPPHDAQEFMEAVRQALAVGDHRRAGQLAAQGAGRYPHDAELAKMAYILAPPVVTRRKGEHKRSPRVNQLWLVEHFEEYKDKWVALRDGQLLGVANSIEELETIIPDFTGVMITRV